jgi:radical SAM superfamily enzyme YgiQ (UPF0313 family)
MKSETNHENDMKETGEKILLVLLPFWDPQIPSLGLACLKSHLSRHGYQAKIVDANLEARFREIYDQYYELLTTYIPGNKQGNLHNIGNQVLRNHMTAHLNRAHENRYVQLVKIIIHHTFYTDCTDGQVEALDKLVETFYHRLHAYLLNLLEQEKPTVLGLSVYGDTLPASLYAFKLAKEKFPTIKTVMGGGIFADQMAPGPPNLEYLVEKTGDDVDKIIIGEGEELLLRFVRGQLKDSQKVYHIKDLQEDPLPMVSAAVPDYSDFSLGYYPHLAHYGARSCPLQCKFCSETINWGKYRKKDVKQTVQEFITLYRQYGSQLFLMTDSTLNPIITALAKEVLKAEVPIYWDGFLRAEKPVCDIANTLTWRQGGFYRAKLGLESGSQRVLDLMNKRITIEQSEAALAALAHAGIKTTTFWLFGFPGETREDFQKTLDFIEKNRDNIYEADCNAFNYYLTGQANSEEWLRNNKGVLLYPAWAKETLISQTWILDCPPSREDAYLRVNRFVDLCQRLGIPNPYSLKEIFKADERWKKLHKNAVPPLVEFKNRNTPIAECRNVKELSCAQPKKLDNEEFDF